MRVLLCVSLLILAGYGYQSRSALTVESDKVKGIICAGTEQWGFMFKGRELWTPTKEQVLDAEAELERLLKAKPPAQSPELWKKLPRYKRQYVGFVVEGHKRIYSNFYCSEEPLACKPVLYDDGGDCFFQVEYDVEKRRVVKIDINGEA